MIPSLKRAALAKPRRNVQATAAGAKIAKSAHPDFALLRQSIFGKRQSLKTGASLASEERGTH
jgi:hypothetical protein